MHVTTIEYQRCVHTRKQKVRTKKKREVRVRVDNNHISLKNRQIARIRLGEKKKVTVQCPSLIKVNYIVLFIYIYISTYLYLSIYIYTHIKKKREVRVRVNNSHISLKNRQIARIRK